MILLFVLIVFLLLYIYWDNNRIEVVHQDIPIPSLPNEFVGYRILQVTDIEGKQFGKDNTKLIEKINSIDYDAIVFTGDMLDGAESTNYKFFYNLIEGIDNKQHALFVPGNNDPQSYELIDLTELKKTEFVQGMEERGVELLEPVHTIMNGNSKLIFVYFESSIIKESTKDYNGIVHRKYNKLPSYNNYHNKMINRLEVLNTMNPADILIALNHYPIVDRRIDYIKNNEEFIFRNYDLIIAGHYHGGQIRIPTIGALFVPEAWYENNGIMPPADRVMGLWEHDGTKQYVSKGLGSSDAIPFLKLRIFNTPEINIITLKKER
jgi:predicted MPP superfamily phosphohydrolase